MKCVCKMFVWQPRYADNKVKIIKYLEKLKKKHCKKRCYRLVNIKYKFFVFFFY